MRLSEITTPEYEDNLLDWQRFELMAHGGHNLTCNIPKISDHETDESYKRRKDYAVDPIVYSNALQQQINILQLSDLAFTFDNPAMQEFSEMPIGPSPDMRSFVLDQIIRTALAYGHAYVIVDRAQINVTTQAEADAAPEPYAYVLPPHRVRAVSYTDAEMNNIRAVITTGQQPAEVDDHGFESEMIDTWTLWSGETIRTEDADGNVLSETIPPDGVVPVLRMDLYSSLLAGLWEPTIKAINHYSIASAGAETQLYPLTVAFSDESMGGVEVGAGRGMQLGKDDDLRIVSPAVEGFEFNRELSERLVKHIRALLYEKITDMGQANAAHSSGVSKARDKDAQEAFSSYLANKAAQFMPELTDAFGRYLGVQSDVITVIPEAFVIQDRDTDLREAEYLSLKYTPETRQDWISTQQRLRNISGLEASMTTEELDEANKELEEQADLRYSNEADTDTLENVATGGPDEDQLGGDADFLEVE